MTATNSRRRQLRVAGLFAGIGGIELGLARAGHQTHLLSEIDPWAQEILRRGFPDARLEPDIRELDELPSVDVVAAGFPCQDLSLAGTQAGISGSKSGLVSHLFRLIEKMPPELVVMENVLYLIRRQRGAQLRLVTDRLEALGYRWAYRVVDTRGFGVPQRRQRVVIVASLGDVDPVDVLMTQSAPAEVDDSITEELDPDGHYGFYWTEGKRAIGWAPNAVPTVKGGSGLGIPSPPAVFDVARGFAGTPTIVDGERLQGFPAGYTDVSRGGEDIKVGKRWNLIGNAVSVPVSTWIGEQLASVPTGEGRPPVSGLQIGRPMPSAVSWDGSYAGVHDVTLHVTHGRNEPIGRFLRDPLQPLSKKALNGFLQRLEAGIMTMPDEFVMALEDQHARGPEAFMAA